MKRIIKTNNIKNGIIAKVVLCFIVLGAIISCEENEVEPKFEKSYNERVQERENELRVLLLANENGWRLTYFTDVEELGGFNFFFKFLDNTTVAMASDFSAEDTVLRNSEFKIVDASTVKLSFSTANAIHKLSDSGNSPIAGEGGSGYKGDFEFLYYGQDGDELIFRGNKTNGEIEDHVEVRFVKAGPNALSYIRKAYENRLQIAPILNGEGTSVFRNLVIDPSGMDKTYAYQYSSTLRFFEASNESDELSTPVLFTDNGFVLKNIEVDGMEFTDVAFKLSDYDAVTDEFVTTVDGTTIIVGSGDGPLTPLTDHKRIIDPSIVGRLGYFHLDGDIPRGLTTPKFEALYEAANMLGFSFYNDLPFGEGTIDYFFIATEQGNVRALYTYDDLDDRIIFNFDGFRDDGSAPTTQGQVDLLNFLFDEEGFYVENLGRVTRFSNHVYTFTSVSDPSVRIAFYNI